MVLHTAMIRSASASVMLAITVQAARSSAPKTTLALPAHHPTPITQNQPITSKDNRSPMGFTVIAALTVVSVFVNLNGKDLHVKSQ
jgi:hypothetical protein